MVNPYTDGYPQVPGRENHLPMYLHFPSKKRSMFSELLTDLLISIGVSSATSSKKGVAYVCFGSVSILFSAVFFLLCYYILSPPAPHPYYLLSVDYMGVHVVGTSSDRKIILNGVNGEYALPNSLWSNSYKEQEILSSLSHTNTAKVWLTSPESKRIQGIITDFLNIPPDNAQKQARNTLWLWLCLAAVFLISGFIVLAEGLRRIRNSPRN